MKTVLVIAGYDPSGGAGVLADIKSIAACGAFGAAAITSLTFQNTRGVFGAEHVSAANLESQVRPVIEDLEIHAVKTGMIPTAALIQTTARLIADLGVPIVIDPVVRSTSGFDLVDDAAIRAITAGLFPLATVVTPNVLEAERITGLHIRNEQEMHEAGQRLLEMGAAAALVKGGHLDIEGDSVDILVSASGARRYSAPRIDTTSTHGTGCSLASAIATHLALGASLEESVALSKEYVTGAILNAPGIGSGHGPLNHFW